MVTRIRSFLSLPKHRRSQSGAAVIEVMLFFPMIFLLTLITLEITNILRIYETMSWTAEYAVRQASEGVYTDGRRFSSDDLRTRIRNKLRDDLPVGARYIDNRDVLCLAYFRLSPGGTNTPSDSDYSCVGTFSNQGDFVPGDMVSVTLRLHYEPIVVGGLFRLFSALLAVLFISDENFTFPDEDLTMSVTFDRIISAEL